MIYLNLIVVIVLSKDLCHSTFYKKKEESKPKDVNRTHLPCGTEVCVVVNVFSILVFWIEFTSRLKIKNNLNVRVQHIFYFK